MEEKKTEAEEVEPITEEAMVDALRFAMIQAKVLGKNWAVEEMMNRLVAAGWSMEKLLSKINWLTTRVYFSKKEGLVT